MVSEQLVEEYDAWVAGLPVVIDEAYENRRANQFYREHGMASLKKKIARSRARRARKGGDARRIVGMAHGPLGVGRAVLLK